MGGSSRVGAGAKTPVFHRGLIQSGVIHQPGDVQPGYSSSAA